MGTMYSNTLKIMGNKEEVKEVREFLKGKTSGLVIDFNNIIPITEASKLTAFNREISLIQHLLYGKFNPPLYESNEENQKRFSEMNIDDQKIMLEKMIKHINDVKEDNTERSYWDSGIWQTMWCEEYHQELLAENKIKFYTRNAAPWYILDVLSKLFPKVQFKLNYWTEAGFLGKALFKNGFVSGEEVPDGNDH